MKTKILSGTVAALALITTTGTANAAVAVGAVYSVDPTVSANAEAPTGLVQNTWLIKGAVSPDCSYYSTGSLNNSIDLGTIGVNTQNNVSVGDAFKMTGAANIVVSTSTAGCNTKNAVTVSKGSVDGLTNTANTGGYDSNEFQANIPYSAKVDFTAAAAGSVAGGTPQSVAVSTTQKIFAANYGAWRSPMTLTINAPITPKALLAGSYQDTLLVELKAL